MVTPAFTPARRVLSVLALSLLAASAAHAQTMRATCDNRAGGCFADVIDSSDPTQFDYNVDPSEIYRTFSAINETVTQNVGSNLSSAFISVNSRFLGASPATRITGFIMDNICHAQVSRVNTPVRAFSNDSTAFCFNVSGASAAAPVRMRLTGAIATQGVTTAQLRIQLPSSADLVNITGGSFNRVLNLTTNGEYHFTSTLNTSNLQPTSGSMLRDVNTYASFVCMADFDGSGTLSVQDIFGFINAWFAGNLAADTNASGSLTVQDIFEYLTAWFSGCS
jgi:hypothetical protein